jgi:uncharacterized protein YjbI with pentapeptide repeats
LVANPVTPPSSPRHPVSRLARVLALADRYIVALTACLVPIGLAFTAATFPGEWLDEHVGNKQWIPPNGVTAWLGAKDQDNQPISTSFHDLLFNGAVDNVSRRRKSLFSNTLVLPVFDGLEAAKIDDPKKLDSVKQTLVLRGRHLESAIFERADLRKSDLEGAQLQCASLDGAHLEGARLFRAQLQGASLLLAHLQRAELTGAQLQGALLDFAQLQGASLDRTQLQGTSLFLAKLQGASLVAAQLQGANFKGSTIAGTDMLGAAVWRTSFEDASLTAVSEDDPKENAMSKEEFAALNAMIVKELPEGEARDDALKRIEKLNPDIFGPEVSEQETLEKGRVGETAYRSALADQLKSLACSGDESAPYIARGLIAYGRIKDTGAQAPGLVEAILKPDCPVSAALTEADKAALKKLAREAQAPESNP